jgi:phage-related protein
MKVIGGALDIIRGIFMVFSSLFKGDWSGVWEGIKLILKGAWSILVGILKQGLNTLKLLWKVAWAAIKALVSAAWEGIKTLVSKGIGKIVEWVRDIPGKFKNALSKLRDTVRDVFDGAMTAGKNKVENIGATIVGWITGIPAKLKEKVGDFKQAGKDLIGAVVDGMKNAAGVISGIAGNVWDAVKSLLNGAIDKINAALEFTINLPGPDITVNPPNIPHLAKGGIVSRPTLALIGEDGPEAVVPLGAKNAPKGRLGVGGGGGDIYVTIQAGVGDPVAIGRQLEKVLSICTGNGGVGRPLQVRTI